MSLRPAVPLYQQRGSVLVTAPGSEPVTATELRTHLRTDSTELPDAEASVATSAFPYSASEGTIVVNCTALSDSFALRIDDGTTANATSIAYGPAAVSAFIVTVSSADQASIGTRTTSGKTAAAYKANDFAVSLNGGAVATDTSGTVPSGATTMRLGNTSNGVFPLSGHLRQITYIPRRLSNAELQARSA